MTGGASGPGGARLPASSATARDRHKQAAAERAVELIDSGMVVGLGSGSTAMFAVRCIGALVQKGVLRDLLGVPTSRATAYEARQLGIPLVDSGWERPIDLTIDGADEVDPAYDLIKGAGGALLREKIVAQASRRYVVVVDDSKLSERLGTHAALPVEVLAFGWRAQVRFLESLGAQVTRRTGVGAAPFATDAGHLTLDCVFGPLARPSALALTLATRAGIVEHGLFVGLATDVIAAGVGGVRHWTRA